MKAYVSSYAKNAALRKVHERDCMTTKAIIGTGSRQLLNLPLGAKLPLLPGSGVLLYTTNLGEKLHQPSSEFTLTDPNLHLLKLNYKSLHDPYLSSYYRRKDILKKLKHQGLITENNKIICNLKEFNEYRDYLTSIKLDFERKYAQEQRLLVKQLLNLQDQGLVQGITLSDLHEWFTNESKKNTSRKALRERFFKMIQTEENIKDLIKEQQCCAILAGETKDGRPNSKQLVHQIQQEELNIKERSVLMRLEEDVKSEFNLERRRRKAKEEGARKRQESFERKMDHQIQKLREFIERQEQYERCRREGGGDGESKVKRGISKKLKKTDSRCLDDKWTRLSRGECAKLPEGQFAVVQEKPKLSGTTKPMLTLEELNRLIQNIITFVVGVLTSIIYPALQKYEEIRSDLDKGQDITDVQDSTEEQIPTENPQFTDSQIGTEVIEFAEKEIETELFEMSEKEIETELLEFSEKEVETELLELSEKEMETDLIALSEKEVETDFIKLSEGELDTHLVEMSEKEIETDLINCIEKEMETEEIEVFEKEVETDVIEANDKNVGTEKEDLMMSEESGKSQESEESQESGESEESVGSQDSTECEDYPEVEEAAKTPDSYKRPGSMVSLVSAKDQEDAKSPTPGKDLDVAESQEDAKSRKITEDQDVSMDQEVSSDLDVAEGQIAEDQESTDSLDVAETQEAAKEPDASKDHDVGIQDVPDKQNIIESQGSSISQGSIESETQTITQRQNDTEKLDFKEQMSTGQVSPSEISDIADEMINDAIVSINEDPLSSPMKLLPSLNYLCEILSKFHEKTDADSRDVLAICRSQVLPAAEKVLRASLEKLTAAHPHLVYILTGFPSTQKTNVNSRKLIFNCKVHCLAIDIVNNVFQKLHCILTGDVIDTILKSKPTTSCLFSKDNVTVNNEQAPSSETEALSPKSDDLCLINIEQEFSTPYVHKICLRTTKGLPENTSELKCSEVFNVIENMNKYVSTRVETVTSPKMKPVICTDSPVPACENPIINFSEEAKDIVIYILKAIHNEVKIKTVARLKTGTDMHLLKESILVDEILDAILNALGGKNADDFTKLKVERRVKPKPPAVPLEFPETKLKLKKRHKKLSKQVIYTLKSETLPAVNIPGMVIYPQMEEVSDIPSTKSQLGQKTQRKADMKLEESKKGTKLPSAPRRDSKPLIQHYLNEEELAYKPKDIPEGSLLEKLFRKSEGTSTLDLYPVKKPREVQTMPKKCFTKDKKIQTKQKKGKNLKQRKVKGTKQSLDKESKQLSHEESKLPDKDAKQLLDKETILPDKESIPEKDMEQLPKNIFFVSDTKPDNETAPLPDQESTVIPDKEPTPLLDQESAQLLNKESAPPTDTEAELLSDRQLSMLLRKDITLLPDEASARLSDKESARLPDKGSTPLMAKESALPMDKKSALLTDKASAPVLDKESASVPNKNSSLVTDEESALVPDKDSSLVTTKESAPGPAKESSPGPAKESAPGPAKESAPGPAKESAPGPAKETAPGPAKESSPGPAKESSPGPAKESAPGPAKESAPGPAKETAPGLAKESAPGLAKESAPGQGKESAPGSTMETAPGPFKESAPGPAKESAPGPAKESAPGPAKESAPGPATESAPGPAKESAPGPATESAPGPAKESAPGPAKESAPGPAKESAPGPATESAPGPAKESAPGPAKESAPGPAKESAPGPAKESAPGPAKESAPGPAKESAPGPAKESAPGPTKESELGPAKESTSGPNKKSTSLPNRESITSKEIKQPPDKELKHPTDKDTKQQMDKGLKQHLEKGIKQVPDKDSKKTKFKDKKKISKTLAEALPYQLELNPEAIKAVSQVIVGLILDRFGLSDVNEGKDNMAQHERRRQYSGDRIDLDSSNVTSHSFSKIDSEQFIAGDSTGRMTTIKKRLTSINLSQVDLMSSRILPPILTSEKSDSAQKQEKSMTAAKAIADAISSNQLHIELIWIKSPSTVRKLDKLVSSPNINLASGDIINSVVDAVLNVTVSPSNLKLDTKTSHAGRKSVTSTSKIASDIFSSVTSVKQYGKTLQSAAQPQNVPGLSHNSMLLVTEVAEELVSNLLQKCLLFQDQTTTDSQVGVVQFSSLRKIKPSETMPFGSFVPESQYEKLFIIIMKSVTDILAGKLNLPNENVISSTKIISKHEVLKTAMDTSDLISENELVMDKPVRTTEVAVKGKPTYLEETRLTSYSAFQRHPGNYIMGQETIIKKLPKKRRISLSKIAVSPTKSLSSESHKLGKSPERLPEAIPKSKKPLTTKKNIVPKKSSMNQNVDKLPLYHKVKKIKVIKDEKTEKIAVQGKSVQKLTHLDNKPLQETLDEKSALLTPDQPVQESFYLLDEKLVKLLAAQLKCEISEMVSTPKKIDAEITEASETDKRPDVIRDSCLELIPKDASTTVLDHIKKLIGLSLHSLDQKQQICANKSTATSNTAGEFTECVVKLFNEMAGSVSQSCKLGLTSPDVLNAIYYEIKKSLSSYREQKSEPSQVAKHNKLPSEAKKHIGTLGNQVTNRLREISQTKGEIFASSSKDVSAQKRAETAKLMKEELIKFALQQLLSDEKFSQEITNIIDEERKVIAPPTKDLMTIIAPEVLKDVVLKVIDILLEKVDSTLSFVPLKNEVSDISQELVNAIVGEVERKYACTDSLEVDSSIDETLAELATKKTVQIISFSSRLTSLNFVSNVTEQVKKILSLKPLMHNQVVLKRPMKNKEKCTDFVTEPVASYFDLISVDLVRFVLEQIKKIIGFSVSSNEMQLNQLQTTSSEISGVDNSSKDTAVPIISSGQSSSSSKTSKKRISFSLPQESVCEKICSSGILPEVDRVAEETAEDVCRYEPGICGLTKMSETLVENIVDSVLISEPSNEEIGVCPFVKTPASLNEDMASKLVQFILDEKNKCQVSDAVFSESSESFSDLRADKLVSGTIEETGPSFFIPQVDSNEKQIYGEEEKICECHKEDIKIPCSVPDLAENIEVVLQPHVMKSITDYVKQSVYQSQLDQLCGSEEADAFKKDTTRQELQDYFLEQVTKENIQKIIECKKQFLFIDKPQSKWEPGEEMESKENVYTADDDLEYDSVCPLTRKETVASWIPTPPVCDNKLYDESFVSVDELHKALCMEGEKSLSRVADSFLHAPVVDSTKSSQLNLLSNTVISNTFQKLESSFEQPMDTDVCKFPDKQRSPFVLSDKESVCVLTAFETSVSEKIGTYVSTCTCPLHFEDGKLSVSSTSTGSSEAESLVQTVLCNMWAGIPYDKQLGSETYEHDKPSSSESSIVLDDLSEELLTGTLVSILSHMIDSLLQESVESSSPSSSQLNLLSENIVSDVMQGLKQSPESSVSSLLVPSSTESSDQDSSQQATFQKGNLRKQTPDKPRPSGKMSSHGKTARKFPGKEVSSSSTSSYSTASRDADHLVQTVLNNILSKHSSELIPDKKAIHQKSATQLEDSSESSLSLNEFAGELSKEDATTIYSYVTDISLQKSLNMPSHKISDSQASFLSEKIVADIMQDLQSSPEATNSFLLKPSFDNGSTSNAVELPVPAIESSAHNIIEGIQTSYSSSAEETTHTTTSEADDIVHITLNDLSITEILDIHEAKPVKIFPRKRLTEFKVSPDIISEHLSVISIKTEPIEVLQQMSLLQTGQDLDKIRRASIANVTIPPAYTSERRVSFEKLGGSMRRGSLDEQGRLDIKRNEVMARNSFLSLLNPDISKVELLKDVETNRELIIRLVAHDVPPDPGIDLENDSSDKEAEIQEANEEESEIRKDVGLFDIDTDSNTEEEHAISEGSTNTRDTIVKYEICKSSLKGWGSIGDKTVNDLPAEKLRYNIAQYERRQSFEAFMELLRKRAEQEPGNEPMSLQSWYSLYESIIGFPSPPAKETGTMNGNRREVAAEARVPHPPQEKKPKSKEFSHVGFDSNKAIISSRISSKAVAELKEIEAGAKSLTK